MAHFKLQGINKAFGATRALNNVDMELPPASRTVLIGSSGAGKSTLLRVLAGLESADSGEITCDGQSIIRTAAHQRGLALLSQDYAVYPHLTAEKNLAAALEPLKLNAQEQSARIDAALQWFGLTELRNRRPSQLSGGQLQRVALAKAIVRRPQLLLLDEPLSQLDVTLREQSRELILNAAQQFGSSLLMVTHDPLDALRMADHVVVLERGRLVQRDTPQRVYQSPCSRYVAELLSPFGINEWTLPASHPSQAGSRIHFRPESARLAFDQTPSSNSEWLRLVGTIESVQFMGHTSLAYFQCERSDGDTSSRVIKVLANCDGLVAGKSACVDVHLGQLLEI